MNEICDPLNETISSAQTVGPRVGSPARRQTLTTGLTVAAGSSPNSGFAEGSATRGGRKKKPGLPPPCAPSEMAKAGGRAGVPGGDVVSSPQALTSAPNMSIVRLRRADFMRELLGSTAPRTG